MAELGYGEDQCMGDLLELVQVALTTPSLSTLLSVILLSAVSFTVTDSPCVHFSPGLEPIPSPVHGHLLHQACFTSETVLCRVR